MRDSFDDISVNAVSKQVEELYIAGGDLRRQTSTPEVRAFVDASLQLSAEIEICFAELHREIENLKKPHKNFWKFWK